MNAAALTAQFNRWQMRAFIVGLIAAVLSLIGAFFNRAQFFHSYLFAWLFWSGLSLGALVIVMMQFLTGGQWGLAIRGLASAAFATLPMMALLFLPVLFGLHDIYGWSNGALGETTAYHHKQQWLNVPFFTARTVFYFVVLMAIALLLRRWSSADDGRDGSPGRPGAWPHPRRARRSRPTSLRVTALSASGIITYVLCMNFASTDWVMSLNPEWYSTIFVVIFIAGQFLAALALMTALLAWFTRTSLSLGDAVPTKVFNDLGSMLMAFVIFWTYVSFSQFLIIWSGNLPKEISWYLERSHGGWQWLALALFVAEFMLPFALLLSRAAKRSQKRLAVIALCILAANILNTFWLVAPSFHPSGVYVHWLDFMELIALGGFWFALFFYFLKERSLLPAQLTEATRNG